MRRRWMNMRFHSLWPKQLVNKIILLALLIMMLAGYVQVTLERHSHVTKEALNVEKIKVVETGFDVNILNTGTDSITIAQVIVDDAFWNAAYTPSATLKH